MRRKAQRVVEQFRGHIRCAALAGGRGSLLDRIANGGICTVGGQREVTSAFLGIRGDLREASVNLVPTSPRACSPISASPALSGAIYS